MIETKNVDISTHPCFNDKARHKWGRIHLPIAANCNIQCNFCSRKYHCINESRPGVTRFLLNPDDALVYLKTLLKVRNNISVIGIAGPGDPLCEPEKTLKVLKDIHSVFPDKCLCISTNGLNLSDFISDLKQSGITHVTVTVNAVDTSIGEKIYSWVRVKNIIYRGYDAAEVLISRQIKAIRRLKENGFTVKVNTVVIPGINTNHIIDIAKEMADLKVDLMNCIPLIPLPDTHFSNIGELTGFEINRIRNMALSYIPQMYHCRRCTADAVGLLHMNKEVCYENH